ncbi:MAG: hypothetical protein HFJ37_02100 [Clostridia bacterium]|nr:hypothetical protein [Clostridia bacterium]
MEEKLFEIVTYFIIYSFLGWVMESIVRTIAEKKIINTGFLKGPFCPIYGIGAIIILLFLNQFESQPILLFFIAIMVLTIWEYLVGVLLEKIFHTKYWDYTDQKFNFQGRVCLVNSICWGILGVIFVKYIHPFIQNIISFIDVKLLHYVMSIIMLVLIIDFITTVIKVKNIKMTLEKVEELNKEIKERLKEIKKLSKEMEKNKEKLTTAESVRKLVEKLKKKRNRTILHLYKNVYRLKKAFPAINTKEITEVLSKKIEIRKNKKNT